tara:strand:- start:463 stop:1581 length:1119 start_codon:yes stop_codon:yes gene_type:complete
MLKNQLPLVTFILGTRPEAIKMAPVIKKFMESKLLRTKIVITGQHKEMVLQVMELFELKEDVNLKIMKNNQTLTYITCSTLEGLSDEFNSSLPELVLVQGDTTTAFSAALAAFYKGISVGHIEAGLRTDDLFNPFPEEANRRMITQIASLHFAPTEKSLQNLRNSNINGQAFKTGNTVIDALEIMVKRESTELFKDINWEDHKIIFITVHRRENWGSNLIDIAYGIKSILDTNPETKALLPLHRNKLVREPLLNILGSHKRAVLIEPLDYGELIYALKRCYFVMTDSGGIQEEAPSLGKPVLVLRETTERPEAITAGTSKLIGTNSKSILKEANLLLKNSRKYKKMSRSINPFGDGKASERILEHCLNFLNK